MPVFVPPDYVSLSDALVQAAAVWATANEDMGDLDIEAAHALFRWCVAVQRVGASNRSRSFLRDRPGDPPRWTKTEVATVFDGDRLQAEKTPAVDAALAQVSNPWGLLEAAWGRLRGDLAMGAVSSSLLTLASGRRLDVHRDAWLGALADRSHLTGLLRVYESSDLEEGIVVLKKAELSTHLGEASPPAASPPTSVAAGSEDKTDKGGSPRKYDSDEFMVEAFALIWENGEATYKTPAKLREAALDAYAAKFGVTPSDDWARPRIKLIWARLGLG